MIGNTSGRYTTPPGFIAIPEEEDHVDEKIRLTRDLMLASRSMGQEEARYLVDAYYQTQENRKRTENQVRSMGKEPGLLIRWMAEKNSTLEKQIARALDEYTSAHPMGDWMRGVVGIGPVISAGLLAYIDMDHCPTVGHIWQFAGIAGAVQNIDERKAVYRVTFKHSIDPNKPPPLHLINPNSSNSGRRWEAAPYYPDGPNTFIYQELVGPNDAWEWVNTKLIESCEVSYRMSGQKPWEKGMKRPFNANLKVICWKIGQSFMKLSNRKDCYYGQIYRTRKEFEINNNENGRLADQAAKALPHFRKTTDAYKWYEKGMLPPAHIDARARRYAVKLFLSHMHGEWYQKHFGKPAPLPYPIAFMQHVHFIPPEAGQTKEKDKQGER